MAGPEWEHISAKAKDLVSKLLTESPKARLTADQALAHPFITERPGAAGDAQSSPVVLPSAAGSTREYSTSAVPLSGGAAAGATDRERENEGGGNREEEGAAVSRSSSQDTDVSTTSADEVPLTTSKSLSPAEGGGGSASSAPSGPAGLSPHEALPSRPGVPDLPPPQPRESVEAGSGDRGARGGEGGGVGRKRAKKDGANEKQPHPYSQLQMHFVSVGGSDEADCGISQESAGASAKGMPRNSNGFHSMSAPPAPATTSGATGGASAQQNGQAKARPRAKPSQASQGPPAKQSVTESTTRSSGRGKRKAGAADAHANQSPTAIAAAAVMSRPSPQRPTGASMKGSTADLTADEIMEYSSDDSPAKAKRMRVGGRGGQTSKGGANYTGSAAGPSSTGTLAQKHGEATNSSGGQQTLLQVGDGGKLNLSKLGPSLSRAGVGSAGSSNGAGAGGGRSSGDRVAQAAAGGAAAAAEHSVGGGAPAGSGGESGNAGLFSDGGRAGKSGKQAKGQSSKSQRTMTHLWRKQPSEIGS